MKALLDAGTPIEAGARHGQTALYFAAEKGRLEVVRLLVERGANVNARDTFFKVSPLGLALGNGHRRWPTTFWPTAPTTPTRPSASPSWTGRRERSRGRRSKAGDVEPLELLAARKAAEARAAKGEKGAAEVRDRAARRVRAVAPRPRAVLGSRPRA